MKNSRKMASDSQSLTKYQKFCQNYIMSKITILVKNKNLMKFYGHKMYFKSYQTLTQKNYKTNEISTNNGQIGRKDRNILTEKSTRKYSKYFDQRSKMSPKNRNISIKIGRKTFLQRCRFFVNFFNFLFFSFDFPFLAFFVLKNSVKLHNVDRRSFFVTFFGFLPEGE